MQVDLLVPQPRRPLTSRNDADAFFNRPERPLEDIIKTAPGRDLLLSWHTDPGRCPGDDGGVLAGRSVADLTFLRLNSGHWFARNSMWTRKFLTAATKLTRPRRKIYTYWNDQVPLPNTAPLAPPDPS